MKHMIPAINITKFPARPKSINNPEPAIPKSAMIGIHSSDKTHNLQYYLKWRCFLKSACYESSIHERLHTTDNFTSFLCMDAS